MRRGSIPPARTKPLCADDQDDTNGEADQGRELLYAIGDVLRDARCSRVKARLADEDGGIGGD